MDAVIRRVIHDPIFVENVVRLLEKNMNLWKTELVAGGQALCTVNIRRGIFQGDNLTPLQFVVAGCSILHCNKSVARSNHNL